MTGHRRKPTDAELEILHVLWDRGPSTVREVFHTLEARRDVGYTTVLKLMQIMADKGLVERDTSVRPQVYRPAVPADQTRKGLVHDLLDRAFAGSPGDLVLQALASRETTAEERRQIRDLLDQLEREAES
jgi:BlaI family penicillinase repressor